MVNICEGEHFTCGETANWKTGVSGNGHQTQARNRKTSFLLGVTEIIVNKEIRTFDISYSGGWSASPSFLMRMEGGGLFACGIPNYSADPPHSVSESYECINTILYFLDMRYNNAVGKEVTEKVTFSEASNAVAGFKETWGVFYYPKFVIKNHVLTTTTVYFIILNGVKTVLKTITSTVTMNGVNDPLILVWPNPPSLAMPFINCDDINQFGFYDYHAIGAGEGQEKIQRDGGDDFYYTDWMRNISAPAQVVNQADADSRYFDYYLGDGVSGSRGYSNPGIFTDDTPLGSIAVDPNGNIMYSAELGGEVFNFLTGGDLLAFDPERIPAESKLFPVGII